MSHNNSEEPIKHSPDGEAPLESSHGDGVSRRRMLQATAAAAGGLTAAGAVHASQAEAVTLPAASRVLPARRTGTIKDLKHIVVMMQENRSYDHYFGTLALPGSAGFGDKQVLEFANGQSIFYQPDATRTDGGYLLPYRMDTATTNAQNAQQSDESNRMGYFTEADIPWQHALAKAYTVGDHNYCSLWTATTPNRIMMWTGTYDPDGLNGGPAINDNADYEYLYTWITYPQILQQAGVTWQIYVNNDTGSFLGDFTDNTVGRDFAAFNPANANAENSVPRQGLLARANVLQTDTTPPANIVDTNSLATLDYVLQEFISDCEAGLVPEISWIVAPGGWSEHPSAAPGDGAVYVNRVIEALHSNPELWDSTLLILTYDENNSDRTIDGDGYFDHMPRPVAPPDTPNDYNVRVAPGLGFRVPLTLVSPWTRGGWVAKETFDHTSIIQLMELFTTTLGKPAICPNISDWRRSVCGDLTSAIDFSSFDNSFPQLPAPEGLLVNVDDDALLPPPPEPAPGQQTFPVQITHGPLKLRPAPYQQHATVTVDRSTGSVTATMTNPTAKAASMQVFTSTDLATPWGYNSTQAETAGIPNPVSKATGPAQYTFDTSTTSGQYDFSIYGQDHFIRRFAGTVIPAAQSNGPVPVVDAELRTGPVKTLDITLTNLGSEAVTYTLTPNDYEGSEHSVTVHYGEHVTINWPTSQYGYYDVIISADTSDGFTYRYAGRIGDEPF